MFQKVVEVREQNIFNENNEEILKCFSVCDLPGGQSIIKLSQGQHSARLSVGDQRRTTM